MFVADGEYQEILSASRRVGVYLLQGVHVGIRHIVEVVFHFRNSFGLCHLSRLCSYGSEYKRYDFPVFTSSEQSPEPSELNSFLHSSLNLPIVLYDTFLHTFYRSSVPLSMKSILAIGVAFLSISTSIVSGIPLVAESLEVAEISSSVVDLEQRQSCTHGPTNRQCWTNGFSASTDMYTSWPNTGRIVTVCLTG